jgi:cellulose synthase/poly-beta-1,6-N-acetylglucosamine synthase-like glycosyltransferase
MSAIAAVFWTSLALVAYVYLGYPLLLAVWSRLAPRPVRREPPQSTRSPAASPTVSVVLAARNERAALARKIDNCLALDYPPDRLEVVLALDAPTDGGERIAHDLARRHPRLTVVESTRHAGKAAALNRAVAAARGEVVVFCDARQEVAADAVRELVAVLADPAVGAVTGELVLLDGRGRPAADGVGLYWRYEKALRAMESRIHSTVGATGALYAVRRELFAPLPRRAILDDVIVPLRATLAGRRTVFAPGARAYDRVCPPEVEFRRKVRTLVGNFQLLTLMPELLLPWRNPVWLQFVSHKLGRLAVPWLLVVLLAANALLLEGAFYAVFFAGQCVWYLLAAAGGASQRLLGAAAGDRFTSSLRGRQP